MKGRQSKAVARATIANHHRLLDGAGARRGGLLVRGGGIAVTSGCKRICLLLLNQRRHANTCQGREEDYSRRSRCRLCCPSGDRGSLHAQLRVIRFNEQGPEGLTNIPSPGAPPKLSEEHRVFLSRLVEEGPIPAVHGVVRWRACDLIMQLHAEFGISVSDDTIYRALKDLGFSHVSARPKAYKQDPDAMDAFKKTSPYVWRKSAPSLRRAHP